MRARLWASVAIVAGLLLVACSPTVPPSVTPTPSAPPSLQPSASEPPTATPTVKPSSAAPSSTAAVLVDPSLLEVLPRSVDGLDVEYAPEASAETAADTSLAATTEALAYAIAATPEGSDLVVAAVTRPRAGLFDDSYFRAWRDSFDGGVCERAGGIAGHAETEIGGRPVFIATCAGGPIIYHTYLGTRGLLVSVSSLGDRRLGQTLMAALQDR